MVEIFFTLISLVCIIAWRYVTLTRRLRETVLKYAAKNLQNDSARPLDEGADWVKGKAYIQDDMVIAWVSTRADGILFWFSADGMGPTKLLKSDDILNIRATHNHSYAAIASRLSEEVITVPWSKQFSIEFKNFLVQEILVSS